jgi:small subunit ribosomal protein S9
LAKEMFHAVGRRKSSVARVFLSLGAGKITINGRDLDEYLHRESLSMVVKQPFQATSTLGKYDIKATVKGGGVAGQAGALRLGISRAILMQDETQKKVLKVGGFLTRDPREKERKKYGQAGARRKFQFSKR